MEWSFMSNKVDMNIDDIVKNEDYSKFFTTMKITISTL